MSKVMTQSSTSEKPIYHLTLDLPNHAISAFELALEPLVQSLLWSADDRCEIQTMEGYAQTRPDPELLQAAIAGAAELSGITPPQCTVAREAQRDWVAENLQTFPPLHLGRFYIYGDHIHARPPAACIPLRVSASVAFGTGQHATTAGCLKAIERLAKKKRFGRVLDMGTGSGILAMAAARLSQARVLACDIDPKAVAVARANAHLNRLSTRIETRAGRGYGALHDPRYGPAPAKYDLIIANILARPLAAMALDLSRHLAPGGRAVLSGLVECDERRVLAPHIEQGVYLEARSVLDGWLTLVLRKPA